MLVRSFIAIELPDKLKLALKRIQENLKQGKQSGIKWVESQGIHLTLKFLGNTKSERIGDITRVMEQSAQGIPPFRLEIKDLGAFPNLKRPQVVWVGIGGEIEHLNRIQQRIEAGLVPLGFAAEARPFTPHLTLARLRNQVLPEERQRLGQLIATTRFEAVSMAVTAISLMRSELTPGGAIYSRLDLVALTQP